MYNALDELLEEREIRGKAEGRQEGKQEGEESAKLNTAKNLLDILEPNVIAERVGLPLEKVMYLKEDSKYQTKPES